MRLTFQLIGGLLVAAVTASLVDAQGRPRATVTPFVETDGVRAGDATRVALLVALAEGLHVQSDRPRDPTLIPTVLTIEPPPGVRVTQLVYPHPTDFKQEGQPEPLAVFEHEFVVGAELDVAGSVPAGDLVIPARLRYQACDDKVCFQPTTATAAWTVRVVPAATTIAPAAPEVFARLSAGRRTGPPEATPPRDTPTSAAPVTDAGSGLARLDGFAVVGTTGGYQGSRDFLQFIHDAEQGIASKGLFDGRGPIAILIIVLAGGLALNLTPCVLPMIPINLAIIGAGARAGSRRRGFLLGSTYGAAMALVYGALGLVVILAAGTFGAINASPWFNAAIAVLFIVLGLAMFDIVNIDFSRYSGGMQNPAGRGSFAVAFTMGAVAALLAGACVAPVVIQVVLFSSSLYGGGATIALALPFCLGVGMALPWPIAGAGLAALPKPGPWMVRVKQAFGVLILGTAIYYGYVSYTLFANRWVDASEVAGSVQEKLEAGWTDSLAAGLERAQREQKYVLIDFWATWCKNCLVMDKTTLEDAEVGSALADYVKIKFQAEDPDGEPARTVMARFGAIGLPTYVILRPKGTPGARSDDATDSTGGTR
ncbi:MAG TPA: cytochrome c biogenesis protein CcdA [Vicinamibacterales bacterium]|nr:cytochrome c biogenesis protein CcdA [Vicinamibacterales bacterium]